MDKTKFTALIILVALAASCVSCGDARKDTPVASTTPVSSGLCAPDPARLGTVERDVIYSSADPAYCRMDIYFPEAAARAVPAVLYVHGGGWVQGDKSEGVGLPEIRELLERGFLVASINYRLAPQYQFPAQIEDVKTAVRFFRANAAAYGLDPARIGAFGGSAGGHLVSLLGTADASAGFEGDEYGAQSSRVQAVVDMFGPTDLPALFGGYGGPAVTGIFGSPQSLKSFSPVEYVSQDDPPFLIVHGDRDTLVPLSQGEILIDKLRKEGVPVTLIVVKNGGHGFAPAGGPISPSRAEITAAIADFFESRLA